MPTINSRSSGSTLLSKSKKLTLTPASSGSALVIRKRGGQEIEKTSISVSTTFGPYLDDMQFEIWTFSAAFYYSIDEETDQAGAMSDAASHAAAHTAMGMATLQLSTAVGDAAANAAAIQAALDAGGFVSITKPGTYYLDTVRIGDDTHFYVGRGVTLKQRAHASVADHTNNVITTKAFVNADVVVSGITCAGQVTSGAEELRGIQCTVTTAAPHGLEAGDYAAVNWTVPEYYSGVFKVDTVLSATSFVYRTFSLPSVLTASASPLAPSGQMRVRKANKNISLIVDGRIDYDYLNQYASNDDLQLMSVILSHAYNVTASGEFVNALKYNVLVACVTHFRGKDFHVDGPSDGVHFTGPIWDARLQSVYGRTQDNMVAVGATEGVAYAGYAITEGAIVACYIGDLNCEGATVPPIRLFGSKDFSVDCEIDGVHGTVVNFFAVQLAPSADTAAGTDIKKCVIRNVTAETGNVPRIQIRPSNAKYVAVIDSFDKPAVTNSAFIELSGNTEKLYLGASYFGAGSSGKLVDVAVNAALTAALNITINGVIAAASSWIVNNNTNINIDIQCSGCDFSSLASSPFRNIGAGGTPRMRVFGSGNNYGSLTSAIINNAPSTIEVYDWAAPADAGLLAATKGQFFKHTSSVAGRNAANQQGQAIGIGTNFYALATGASGANTLIV